MNPKWHSKPYYSLNAYLQDAYGEKCYKIALNAGLSCPHRDPDTKSGGCIFCSAGGSGEFAVELKQDGAADIAGQLAKGRALFRAKKVGRLFIAYFQAYTNTYGPIPYLREIYRAALSEEDIIGISVATRPDCVGEDVLLLFAELKQEFPDKFIWVEFGLQTIHDRTAKFIRRGYPLSVFTDATEKLSKLHIPVIAHVILGLPGESEDEILQTIRFLNSLPVWGVKLQLLHILKDTALGAMYETGKLSGFEALSLETYTEILIRCLEELSPDIVIHRLTGDAPKDLLIAPAWSLDKRHVLNTIHRIMKEKNTYQGRCFHAGSVDTV